MIRAKLALFFFSILTLVLSACGGGGGSGGGSTTPPPPPPPPPNETTFNVDLNKVEAFQFDSSATGNASAEFTLNLDDNTLTGSVTLNGITADNVSLNIGFAGEVGSEFVTLTEENSTTWTIPDSTVLSSSDRLEWESGAVYVLVTTTAEPQGLVRGQVLPDGIELFITEINQDQTVPPTASSALAWGYITLNSSTGDIAARAKTQNFADASLAHIHQALAGLTGGVAIGLTQDTSDSTFWSNGVGRVLDASELTAFNNGSLYFNFHSPSFPAGEIRGQIIPSNIELTLSPLNGDNVVIAGAPGVTTTASAIAASTFDILNQSLTIVINTIELDDASSATLHQAPQGLNGPSIGQFVQGDPQISRWVLESFSLSADQLAALQNQGLYFSVATPAHPEGEVRAQFTPESSSQGATDVFQVTSIDPENAAEVSELPDTITFTFNRDVLPDSLEENTISLTASGGDGSFGEANDVPITGITASVVNNTLLADLTGVTASDDIYQVAIANNIITDSEGILLDGDSDSVPGGIFSSTFNLMAPVNNGVTFTSIQDSVFSPICAVCHGGAAPSAGLNLESGQAFSNIVNVQSGQSNLLRVEPSNPDDSYLIRKLEGGPGIVGNQMPLGQSPLPQNTIDNIRQWISDGAPNN